MKHAMFDDDKKDTKDDKDTMETHQGTNHDTHHQSGGTKPADATEEKK